MQDLEATSRALARLAEVLKEVPDHLQIEVAATFARVISETLQEEEAEHVGISEDEHQEGAETEVDEADPLEAKREKQRQYARDYYARKKAAKEAAAAAEAQSRGRGRKRSGASSTA